MASWSSNQIYAPLTTLFSPAPECSRHWTWDQYAHNPPQPTVISQDYRDGTPTFAMCYPSGTWPSSQDVGMYSPGICPSGQTTASSWVSGDITTAVCCSSGFEIKSSAGDCTSTYTTSTRVTVLDYLGGGTGSITFFSEVSAGLAVQYAIKVLHQSSDASIFPTETTSSGLATVPASPSAIPSGSKSSPTISPTSYSEPSSGLGTGSRAAIGIGVVLGVVLLIVAIIGILSIRTKLRRGRGSKLPLELDPTPQVEMGDRPQAGLATPKGYSTPYVAPVEVHGISQPAEMEASLSPEAELEQLAKEEERIRLRRERILASNG